MKDEYIRIVEREIKNIEERLNILKSIRDSSLDIKLLKQNNFIYNGTGYEIVDEMIVHNGYIDSIIFFPISIAIKENNMSSVSFDEYIVYTSSARKILSNGTTYKKIEDHIFNAYRETVKSGKVFKNEKNYLVSRTRRAEAKRNKLK